MDDVFVGAGVVVFTRHAGEDAGRGVVDVDLWVEVAGARVLAADDFDVVGGFCAVGRPNQSHHRQRDLTIPIVIRLHPEGQRITGLQGNGRLEQMEVHCQEIFEPGVRDVLEGWHGKVWSGIPIGVIHEPSAHFKRFASTCIEDDLLTVPPIIPPIVGVVVVPRSRRVNKLNFHVLLGDP